MQEEWLNEFNRKLMRVVSSSLDGVLCNKILKFLLRAERHWVARLPGGYSLMLLV